MHVKIISSISSSLSDFENKHNTCFDAPLEGLIPKSLRKTYDYLGISVRQE